MSQNDNGNNGINDGRETLVDPGRVLRDENATVSDGGCASREDSQRMKTFRSFRALEQLHASGGEADIYLIEKESRRYILKLYRFGMNPKEEVLRKTMEMSESLSRHIVRIIEYGFYEKARRWYEIQEFAEFGTLKEMIAAGIDDARAERIISEIAAALRALHENHILHLDLKPSNILVRSREPLELIFTDFGVSSLLDAEMSKKMTGVKGTPLYWAPESFTGVVGREADYWALGMIALEALTGKHIFAGLDTKVIMYTLSTKGVEVPKNIPGRFRPLVSGLLSRDPKRRWGAGEVAHWLEGVTKTGEEDSVPGAADDYEAGAAFEEITYKTPYKFKGREFYTIESFTEFFTGRPEFWEDARIHLTKGYVTKWLENNEDYERGADIEKIRSEDGDLALIRFVHKFNLNLDFHYYGIKVDFDSIYAAVAAHARGESKPEEKKLAEALLSGKLFEYYAEFLGISGRPEDEPYEFIKLVNSNIIKYPDAPSKLEYAAKLLTAVAANENLVIPIDAMDDFSEFIKFLNDNLGAILTKDEFEKAAADAAIPEDIRRQLFHESKEYAGAFRKFKKLVARKIPPGEISELTVRSGETVKLVNGNYRVRGEITVEAGGDLLIDGAGLLFDMCAGITCLGLVKAENSSFAGSAAADGWKNVALTGEGARGSSISGCSFKGARGRPREHKLVNLKGGAVYIENVATAGGANAGPAAGAVVLKNNKFEACSACEGGAIYSENSDVTIENCEFVLCTAIPESGTVSIVTGYGGAIYCAAAASGVGNRTGVTAKNNRFVSCGANFGGGAHVSGPGCKIIDCVFDGCHAKRGGGMYFQKSTSAVRSCRFINCQARAENAKMFARDFYGGGIYAFESSPAIAACNFEACTAQTGGGAIFSEGDTGARITGCDFVDCAPDECAHT